MLINIVIHFVFDRFQQDHVIVGHLIHHFANIISKFHGKHQAVDRVVRRGI
jgi:hypothetical protein